MRAYPLYSFDGEKFIQCKSSMIMYANDIDEDPKNKSDVNSLIKEYMFGIINDSSEMLKNHDFSASYDVNKLLILLDNLKELHIEKYDSNILDDLPFDGFYDDHYFKILSCKRHKDVLENNKSDLLKCLSFTEKIILLAITPESVNGSKAVVYLLSSV